MKKPNSFLVVLALGCAVALAAPPAALAARFRFLVGNDDGVGAPGIAAVVRALSADPSLEVSVYAPATNQSGTGDSITTGPLTVLPATTADGYPAWSVAGFPADGVLFGVLQGLAEKPDLVVSGINAGQNVAELVNISGTVGVGLWASRLGIPAFAVSQALGPNIDYEAAAQYTRKLVNSYRTNATFRSKLVGGPGRAKILNINFPTCATGSLRGVRAVSLGVAQKVVAYEPGSGSDVWDPVVVRTPVGSTDCDSKLKNPTTDLEALDNGFASVTPLNSDLTNDALLPQITRFVQQ